MVPVPLGADGRADAANGLVSHGAKPTEPTELAQAGDPGPPRHPHQFCVATMLPPPLFSIPDTALILFRAVVTWPGAR